VSFRQPDVLVLGGGGTLGEAWMLAVLAGLEDAHGLDARACRLFLGTSAGSIVAASLAAGTAPAERLREIAGWPDARPPDPDASGGAPARNPGGAGALVASLAAPLTSLAFAATSNAGALLRRTALRAVPTGRRSLGELGRAVARSGLGWDGRLLVAAVDVDSGRRVMFGSPDALEVSVALAVQASCAVPGMFSPVHAAGRTYVDGGVWSPTNMDGAPVERGERVLCLNPTGSLRVLLGTSALGRVSRTVAAAEALVLRHRGALVTVVNPDRQSAVAIGANLMDARRSERVIAAGLAQGRRAASSHLRQAA
jgi:NTE family protein